MTDAVDSSFYHSQTERFHIPIGQCTFKSQFSNIYTCRLAACRPFLEASVMRHWGASTSKDASLPIRSLADLTLNEECVIIGTLYKEMLLKPSVIRQLAELEQGSGRKTGSVSVSGPGAPLSSLTSEQDDVFLEDELQRILLQPCQSTNLSAPLQIDVNNLVTGIVVAIRGEESEANQGIFMVKDAKFLEPGPEYPITAQPCDQLSPQTFPNLGACVVFASGLGFIGCGAEMNPGNALALRLLGDWLRGSISLDGSFPRVIKFIILGDSIQASSTSDVDTIGLIQQARYLTRKTDADSVTAMLRFDTWLSELPLGPGVISSLSSADCITNGIPVEVLSGPSDCVSHMMPQQPLHPTVLPKSVSRAGGPSTGFLRGTTNPSISKVGKRKILATSGQGITDIFRYTNLSDSLECMEASLHWGHLAPTCPDTLFGYPLPDRDLLLFEISDHTTNHKDYLPSSDYPDVYVAGNQPTASWRRASLSPWLSTSFSKPSLENEGALMISVPRFDKTHTIVLLELDTLRCLPVRFDISQLTVTCEEDANLSTCVVESSLMDTTDN